MLIIRLKMITYYYYSFFYDIKDFFNCVCFLMYRLLLNIDRCTVTRHLNILLVMNKTLIYIKNRNTYVSVTINKINLSKIYFIYFLIFIYEHIQLNKLIR